MTRSWMILLSFLAAMGTSAAQIPIARVGDVTHLQGQGPNVLLGYGLVTGLEGTGDGSKFLPTMEALAKLMKRFGVEVSSLDELAAAKNVAIVSIEATIPDHGSREGEQLDVTVSAIAAKSLRGGRLISTPLIYHDRRVKELFGFAQGPITLAADRLNTGRIRGGARMEKNVLVNVVATGSQIRSAGFSNPWIEAGSDYITLVLDDAHAGWAMAAAVAQAVDKELTVSANVERVALAMDSKNILVLLPAHQRGDPASWIRDVERTPILMESNEARITINRNSGTIVVSGDTRMSAVIISQLGMTVTIANPLAENPAPTPAFEQNDFVALDSQANRLPNVKDLLEALNRLKVPFNDRVAILEEIHRAGKLHARIMYEG